MRGDDMAQAARPPRTLWQMWTAPAIRASTPPGRGHRCDGGQDLPAADARSPSRRESARFAEGWNKRRDPSHILQGLRGGDRGSAGKRLARNPNHFGALSARDSATSCWPSSREARELFRRTLAVHPIWAARGRISGRPSARW